MEKFTMYLGLNDKDTKKQEVTTTDAIKTVNKVVGDNTIQVVHGHYTHEDGSEVDETTLKVEMLFKTFDEVKLYCTDLKRLLNQESIALSREPMNSILL